MRWLGFLLSAVVCGGACGGASASVRDGIRAQLARRDVAGAAAAYLEWRKQGADDEGVLRKLALTAIYDALSSASAPARAAAIDIAERVDAGELFDPVSRLLDDEDPVVRAAAAAACIHSHPDAPAVLTRALSGESPAARRIAVAALGRKVGAIARPDILTRVQDKDGPVRAEALAALTRLKDQRDRAVALMALEDPYLGARLAAFELLRSLGDTEALRPLLKDSDPYVALRAAVLFKDLKPIYAGLAAKDWPVRAAALNALVSAPLAVPLLADPEPSVRLAAARALIRAGQAAQALPVLRAGLSFENPELRLQAAGDLARLHDPEGESTVTRLARDPDANIRRQALRMLPRGQGAPEPIVRALGDADPMVSVTAAEIVLDR